MKEHVIIIILYAYKYACTLNCVILYTPFSQGKHTHTHTHRCHARRNTSNNKVRITKSTMTLSIFSPSSGQKHMKMV